MTRRTGVLGCCFLEMMAGLKGNWEGEVWSQGDRAHGRMVGHYYAFEGERPRGDLQHPVTPQGWISV